jgi:hypothetical protein
MNKQEEKQNFIEFVDYSIAVVWIIVAGFLIGVFKKISDFLIDAAIEKYDTRIDRKVKLYLEPIEKRLDNLSEEIHSTVSKKNNSNIRSELLLETLEEIFGKDLIKKILTKEQIEKITNEEN